jgi:hypothetical protein
MERSRIIFKILNFDFAGHSGRAVLGTKCLRPLKHWNRGFEFHSRHERQRLFYVSVVLYRQRPCDRAYPPSKESYQLSIRSIPPD